MVWLVVDSDPNDEFRETVDAALATGKIGLLTEHERNHFSRVLGWWAKSAGIDETVLLDASFRPGALNIYSVGARVTGLPNTSPGNAIYDATRDTIFISVELFRPTSVVILYGDIDVQRHSNRSPQTSGYLLFVFLHELGHRVLHRTASDNRGRETLEVEADQFAISVMKNAYASGLPKGVEPIYRAPVTNPLRAEGKTETLYLDIAGSVLEMTNAMLHTETLFSPYFRDIAHPAFIERAIRVVEIALAESKEKWTQSFVQITREHLRRVRRTLQDPLVEVQVPKPIVTAGLLGDDLVIFDRGEGKSDGQELRFSLKAIDRALCHASGSSSIIGPEEAKKDKITWTFPTRFAEVSRGATNSAPEIFSHGYGWFRKTADRWQEIAALSRAVWAYENGHHWVLVADKFELASSWTVYLDRKLIGRIRKETLTDYLRTTRSFSGETSITARSVLNSSAIFVVRRKSADGQRHAMDYLKIDLNTLKITDYIELNLDFSDDPNRFIDSRGLAFLYDEGSIVPYAVGFTMIEDRAVKPRNQNAIGVWELSSNLAPRLIATHPMTVSNIAGAWDLRIFQRVGVPFIKLDRTADAKGLLIDVYLDSLYYFDPASRSLEFLFHPGGTARSSNIAGHVAVYARGANKVYMKCLPSRQEYRACGCKTLTPRSSFYGVLWSSLQEQAHLN